MSNQNSVEEELSEEDTIASLNAFFSSARQLVLNTVALYNVKIQDLDSWLDLKWNLLKDIVSKNNENNNDQNYELCKAFFGNENNRSKMRCISLEVSFSVNLLVANFVNRLSVSDKNKIDVEEIYCKLSNDQSVKLEADDAFIKFCKGMYRWSQPNVDIKDLFKCQFFKAAINQFFKQDQYNRVAHIFNHRIDKIECDDKEFTEFKKILSQLTSEINLKYDSNLKQLGFVEKEKIVEENENSNLNKEIENSQRTGHTTNPYTVLAIIGIFLPFIPSIVFVFKIVCDDKYKSGGIIDILLFIAGLVPLISTIVFGILAYKYNAVIDNNNKPSGSGTDYNKDDKQSMSSKETEKDKDDKQSISSKETEKDKDENEEDDDISFEVDEKSDIIKGK